MNDMERELGRSALLGINYLGSEPLRAKDALRNAKALGQALLAMFRHAGQPSVPVETKELPQRNNFGMRRMP